MARHTSFYRAPGTGPWSEKYIRNWRDLPTRPYRLDDVLKIYLAARKDFLRDKSRKSIEFVYAWAIRYFGDCCFTSLKRRDIVAYAQHLASHGLRQGGIQNHLHVLHGGIRIFILEFGLEIHNPMTTFHAHELWEDEREFPILSASEVQSLRAACLHSDDDIRWLLAMLIDTGARPAEVAGLALDDLHVDVGVPHIEIRAHPWRGLKSPAAERRIPLIGAALWAAKCVVSHAGPSQHFAFPRHFERMRFVERAKGTLGRWLFARGFKGSLIALRRTFVERLRLADCPQDVRAALAGWRLLGMEEEYGIGYSLSNLQRWMLRISEPLPEPRALKAAGYDRELSLYDCGLRVMQLIRKLPYPSFQAMIRDGSMERVDIRRGLAYARRQGSIDIVCSVPAARSPAYRLTGTALAKHPAAARARKAKNPNAPNYDYRKLLLSLPLPPRLEEAACFPNCSQSAAKQRLAVADDNHGTRGRHATLPSSV